MTLGGFVTMFSHSLAMAAAATCMLAIAPPRLARGADGLGDLLQHAGDATEPAQERGSNPGARRLPVPPAEALRRSATKVNEIFGGDAKSATTPEAKSQLAATLLGHAAESTDATDRYVLLESARKFAVEGGDATTALKAIDQISDTYAIDGAATKQASLESLAAKAPVASLGRVIDMLLGLAATAADRGDVEAAEDLAQSAASAARRSKDRDRQKAVADRLAEVRQQKKLAAQAKPLVERLAQDPSDREAAADLGRFRCFQESKWAEGLPLLAKGADAALAALARAELNNSGSPSELVSLGDAWADHAENAKGAESSAAEDRARLHYTQALGSLTGLDRARVQKRLESLGPSGSGKRPKGLVLWLDASASGSLRGPEGQIFDRSKASPMPVAEWLDVGGGTGNAKKGARSGTPVAKPGVFGRSPGIVFAGGEWLVSDIGPNSQGTLAIVFKPAAVRNMRAIGCPAGKPGIRVNVRDGGSTGIEVARDDSAYDGQGAPAGKMRPEMPTVLLATWPKPFLARINGRTYESGQAAAHDPLGQALIIGACHEGGFDPFAGAIAELRLYDRILPMQELIVLEGELTGKWQGSRP
jgi:hypothetical protein